MGGRLRRSAAAIGGGGGGGDRWRWWGRPGKGADKRGAESGGRAWGGTLMLLIGDCLLWAENLFFPRRTCLSGQPMDRCEFFVLSNFNHFVAMCELEFAICL